MGIVDDISSITQSDVHDIIAFNKALVRIRGSEFEVDTDILNKIIKRVNAVGGEHKVVERAARLLGGITFRQPFFDGNKETALAMTIDYLQRNGYELLFATERSKKEMFDALMKMEFGTASEAEYAKLANLLKKLTLKF